MENLLNIKLIQQIECCAKKLDSICGINSEPIAILINA